MSYVHPVATVRLPWFRSLVALLALFVTLGIGQPSALADDSNTLDDLFAALKAAQEETAAREIEHQIWQHWLDSSPDAETRQLIDKAMSRREQYDFEGARLLLNEAVEQSPGYSEVWNQRAFILFLQGDLDRALEDVDRTLELEPRHFGALSGRALILMQQGRMQLGQKALREAVEIHPFLKERHLLIQPKGQKL
ncbi:tetratricopeptide repeat protein [Roseibium sp.]|uniref:tetratricopeptide repeat protein n=1 Tax=Roseibium sp. TaxID=1936156 RepID=UPI003A96AED2